MLNKAGDSIVQRTRAISDIYALCGCGILVLSNTLPPNDASSNVNGMYEIT